MKNNIGEYLNGQEKIISGGKYKLKRVLKKILFFFVILTIKIYHKKGDIKMKIHLFHKINNVLSLSNNREKNYKKFNLMKIEIF